MGFFGRRKARDDAINVSVAKPPADPKPTTSAEGALKDEPNSDNEDAMVEQSRQMLSDNGLSSLRGSINNLQSPFISLCFEAWQRYVKKAQEAVLLNALVAKKSKELERVHQEKELAKQREQQEKEEALAAAKRAHAEEVNKAILAKSLKRGYDLLRKKTRWPSMARLRAYELIPPKKIRLVEMFKFQLYQEELRERAGQAVTAPDSFPQQTSGAAAAPPALNVSAMASVVDQVSEAVGSVTDRLKAMLDPRSAPAAGASGTASEEEQMRVAAKVQRNLEEWLSYDTMKLVLMEMGEPVQWKSNAKGMARRITAALTGVPYHSLARSMHGNGESTAPWSAERELQKQSQRRSQTMQTVTEEQLAA